MNTDDLKKLKIAFFGTPEFAVTVLEELASADIKPSLIITNPDMPKGRGLELAPPPVKIWAQQQNIAVRQPKSLKTGTTEGQAVLDELKQERWDLFIVVAYGKILPREIIELPLHRTLNVHGSLLPKFRGASPIESAIIADEKETGITIMILDEEMDHGPILAAEKILIGKNASSSDSSIKTWPASAPELRGAMAHAGGRLLARIIPLWIERKIEAVPQDHHLATYTKKISKKDGEIDLKNGDPYQNFLKIQAYEGWPGTYFFEEEIMENKDKENLSKDTIGNTETEKMGTKKRIRMVIKKTEFKDGKLIILRVVPEGKKETDYKMSA